MFIKINPTSLRAALQALRTLYPSDCPLYYSIEERRMTLESAGGAHFFNISFDAFGTDTLPLQKTTLGAFTQNLSLLDEYSDLILTEAAITDEGEFSTVSLMVKKQYKDGNNEPIECLTLSKVLQSTAINETDRLHLRESRDLYCGDLLFKCPASISVAADKAHTLRANALYLRGKQAYCMSGDGVCRVSTPELSEDLEQDVDAEFAYSISKLNADEYRFYEKYVSFEVNAVQFKLGNPSRVTTHQITENIIDLFDAIQPEVRIYCKEVRTLHGSGPLRVCSDKTLLLTNSDVKLSAPFILPLSEKVPTVAVSETVSKAAGEVWTVGTTLYKGKAVALVSGDCDILFNANA